MDSHYYHVNVAWDSDRKGMMCSPELKEEGAPTACIEVATPPEFPKGIPGIWSPEHLFTASVSSCFMTTFLAVAENSRLEFSSFSCKSKGKLDKIDGKLRMTEVQLEPVVTILKQEDHDKAMKVLKKSESACLITNSINSTVMMTPTIIVGSATPAT